MDEELVERWSEKVVWQYCGGLAYYAPELPCDATRIGGFRTAIGEAGVEELLKASIDAAVGKPPEAKPESPMALTHLNVLRERAERIGIQRPRDKNRLYALHAPEVECIGKGKARKPHEPLLARGDDYKRSQPFLVQAQLHFFDAYFTERRVYQAWQFSVSRLAF